MGKESDERAEAKGIFRALGGYACRLRLLGQPNWNPPTWYVPLATDTYGGEVTVRQLKGREGGDEKLKLAFDKTKMRLKDD